MDYKGQKLDSRANCWNNIWWVKSLSCLYFINKLLMQFPTGSLLLLGHQYFEPIWIAQNWIVVSLIRKPHLAKCKLLLIDHNQEENSVYFLLSFHGRSACLFLAREPSMRHHHKPDFYFVSDSSEVINFFFHKILLKSWNFSVFDHNELYVLLIWQIW